MNENQVDHIPLDPLVDEVRAIRKAISDQFGNDVDRLCDFLEQQSNQRARLAQELLGPHREGIAD